jgi:hypothetical protein
MVQRSGELASVPDAEDWLVFSTEQFIGEGFGGGSEVPAGPKVAIELSAAFIFERCALLERACLERELTQHFALDVHGKRLDATACGMSVVEGVRCLCQAAEPCLKHDLPVDPELAYTTIVNEGEDVVSALVDLAQQVKDQLECVSSIGMLALSSCCDAQIEHPVAIRDE